MIENLKSHPYSRAVCVATAKRFEREAAEHLINAQWWADDGRAEAARHHQSKARLAQQRAEAWRIRANNASDCPTWPSIKRAAQGRALPGAGVRSAEPNGEVL